MSEQWFSGPPPSIGWWPASRYSDLSFNEIRWWSGYAWSYDCYAVYSAKSAGEWAELKAPDQEQILWTHRPESWPEWSKT